MSALIFLLAGTPGQAKTNIAQKICDFLASRGVRATFASTERELAAIVRGRSDDNAGSSNTALANVIGQAPQEKIRELWPRAIRAAYGRINEHKGVDVGIICCSLSYYRSETYEFYSPINISSLRKAKPLGVLTLIDDSYDVYYRLSRGGEVFHFEQLIARSDPPTNLGVKARYRHALNLTIQCLLRVLVWREKEIDGAQIIARTLGIPANVLATKHPVESGVRLMLGTLGPKADRRLHQFSCYPAYVSHPITRPRGERNRTSQWPRFVHDLASVVKALGANGQHRAVVPVCPTAIDEFRLLRIENQVQPRLAPRWPIAAGNLLYCRPTDQEGKNYGSHDEFESDAIGSIFDPPIDEDGLRLGMPLTDGEVSGMLSTLNQAVRLQMAGRDHLLVRQCPGFFLFRPVYDGEFTSGVTNELHTYDQIRKWEIEFSKRSDRKIAFVHDRADVLEYLADGKLPIRTSTSAVYRSAVELSRTKGKTRQPNQPNSATARALREPGEIKGHVQPVYEELFPRPPIGSIGTEEPVSLTDVQETLTQALDKTRAESLAGFLEGRYRYVFAQEKRQHERTFASAGEADTYVDVVEGIDVGDRIMKAAGRVRDFFHGASGASAARSHSKKKLDR